MEKRPLDYSSLPPHQEPESIGTAIVTGAFAGFVFNMLCMCIVFMEGGIAVYVCYPLSKLLERVPGDGIAVLSVVVAFFQMPIEGALITLGLARRRPTLILTTLAAHVAAVLANLLVT
jgi:hypothetical protein